MKQKSFTLIFSLFFILYLLPTFSFAQTVTVTAVEMEQPPMLCSSGSNYSCNPESIPRIATPTIIKIPTVPFCIKGVTNCAPILTFATSTKKYIIPKPTIRIAPIEANYSIFPEHLNFTATDRNIFVVSRKWQTGCLYDVNGNIMHLISTSTASSTIISPNKFICMQTATGKKDLPTELGLYNIQTKYSADYHSGKYTTDGVEITATSTPQIIAKAAPMPYAMHFGRIIGKSQTGKFFYDFSDGSALHEKQTINKLGSVGFVSHGCIAVEKGKGHFLQSLMTYGDLIMVVNETFPNTLDEAISLDK